MDRKAIIVLVVSFALILFWPKLINHFYPPPPKTNEVATATGPLPAPDQTNGVTTAAAPAVAPVREQAPEQTITLTNQHGQYVFSSHGGGLKLVEFAKYRADIECGRTIPAERLPATLNTGARVPVLGLVGNLGEDIYELSRTPTGVRAQRSLDSGLQITKDFELSTNYQ
ncbi:MAG: hypothetical protein ACK4UN_16335, partial [Limisphaerales bacterium]